MTRVLVATTNPHKLREIRGLLAEVPVELVGLDVLPPVEHPEETGDTFEANARLKALYYDAASSGSRWKRREPAPVASGVGRPIDLTVAEDSGLVIDALDGEPGIRSARFLRADATYPERFAEIFRRLEARKDQPRTARFICALAVVRGGDVVFETRGTVEGEITRGPRGTAGFGYDPIFYYPNYGCTLAEVTETEKLQVAHRGQAFRSLARWLRERRTENRF
jgi:XTP/dITP diphosphohydrolase